MANERNPRNTRALLCCVSILLICVLACQAGAADERHVTGSQHSSTEIDTTNVRDVKPASNSPGGVLADVPGFVLQSPVKLLKYTTKGALYAAYRTPIRRVINHGISIGPFYLLANAGTNSGIESGVGLKLKSLMAGNDRLTAKASYSVHHYQTYELEYRAEHLPFQSTGVTFWSRYRRYPRESFYGIGMNNGDRVEADYTLEQTALTGAFIKSLGHGATLRWVTGYVATNLFDGEDGGRVRDLDSIASLFGLTASHFRDTRYVSVGPELEFSWLDNLGQPTRGGLVRLGAFYDHGVGESDDLRIFTLRGEADKYVNIWRKRIVALHVIAERRDNVAGDGAIPFYLNSSLGGVESLRGYRRDRFVDNDMAIASLEYRWPIWRSIDAYLFLEEGRTFANIAHDFTTRDWRHSYGTGLRLWNAEGVLLSAFVARSVEDTRYYLQTGTSW